MGPFDRDVTLPCRSAWRFHTASCSSCTGPSHRWSCSCSRSELASQTSNTNVTSVEGLRDQALNNIRINWRISCSRLGKLSVFDFHFVPHQNSFYCRLILICSLLVESRCDLRNFSPDARFSHASFCASPPVWPELNFHFLLFTNPFRKFVQLVSRVSFGSRAAIEFLR